MKTRNKLKKMILDYLKEAKLLQIATAKNNKPWVATLWYVHDSKFNLYFISRRSRRHSLELMRNPDVAGAITKTHIIGSGEKVRGLQFEGKAEECHGATLKEASKLYLSKYPRAVKIPLEKLQDPNFTATYVVHPRTFVLFDEVNFPKEPRQEIKI